MAENKHHTNKGEAKTFFVEEVAKRVSPTSRWMGVLFTIDEDGALHLFRTSWDFPYGEVNAAAELLKENFKEEVFPSKPPPLKPADIISLQEKIEQRRREAREREKNGDHLAEEKVEIVGGENLHFEELEESGE